MVAGMLATLESRLFQSGGEWWVEVSIDGRPIDPLGPFSSKVEAVRAHDDLKQMIASVSPIKGEA